MPRYQDFIEWIADFDDTQFDESAGETESVSISMISHVFNKPVETVIKDVRRAQAVVPDNGLKLLINELCKLPGFSRTKLKSGHGYDDLFRLSYARDTEYYKWLVHIQCWKLTTGAVEMHFYFYENGNMLYVQNEDWSVIFPNGEIDIKKIADKIKDMKHLVDNNFDKRIG